MVTPIIVFFGSILFGFALLYLAIRFWRRGRNGNSGARQFGQNYGSTGTVLNDYDNNDSEIDDYTDYSSLTFTSESKEETVGASAELSADLAVSNETSSESSWNYNSAESSSSYSDSSSYSSCSSSSTDSSSSCSSGSSCSSSSD